MLGVVSCEIHERVGGINALPLGQMVEAEQARRKFLRRSRP
jgi:hypothetical protein